MPLFRTALRVSNRSILVFIFFFSFSSSCLYFIYVAPGMGKASSLSPSSKVGGWDYRRRRPRAACPNGKRWGQILPGGLGDPVMGHLLRSGDG